MDAGVSIQIKMLWVSTPIITVKTVAKKMDTHIPFVIYRFRLSESLAPNVCATGIAKPLQTPIQNPKIMKLIEPVEPTAAKAFTPSILPTMIESIIL